MPHNNVFLKEKYLGADGEMFKAEFAEYLKAVVGSGRWDAMSDHALFLQGGKQAIEEIIREIES